MKDNVWTATDARRRFYALIEATLKRQQVVTMRGVPRYTFTLQRGRKTANGEHRIVVRAIKSRGRR